MNNFQLLVSVTATCGGLLFGYEIGVMNVVLMMDAFRIFFGFHTWDGTVVNGKDKNIKEDYAIDKTALHRRLIETEQKSFIEGFITSSFLLGAVCGAFLSYYIAEKYCSQKIIMISAIAFSAGSIIQSFSLHTLVIISFGRFISGLSIGCISVLCPTYIAEVAPARIRGVVLSCYQLMIAIGIVIATAINGIIWYFTNVKPENVVSEGQSRHEKNESIKNLEWRLALFLQVIPGIILASLMYFLPSSPRWLCSENHDEEALKTLAKLNETTTSDILVQEELKAIQNSVAVVRAANSVYGPKELFNAVNRRRSFITFFMQLFQQWTGINTILYYQSQLYNGIGFSKVMSTVVLPIINNSIHFVSSVIGMLSVQRIGRKPLLVVGGLLLLILNLSIYTCSNHTLDYLEFRSNQKIDCNTEGNSFPYYISRVNATLYGNECHKTTIHCYDNINIVSYDVDGYPFTDSDINLACDTVHQLRYEQGNLRRYLTAGSVFLFTFVYACTWGPVPKVYQAEVFPLPMRVKGTTFSTFSNFVSSWIIVLITPMLIKFWGMKIFLLFTSTCFLAILFAVFFCVES
eukprot:jgi/Orpsp1_1/1176381/evm.model.c7180000057377.3